jgi:hypothetical protein
MRLFTGLFGHFVVIRPVSADSGRDYAVVSSFGSLTRL